MTSVHETPQYYILCLQLRRLKIIVKVLQYNVKNKAKIDYPCSLLMELEGQCLVGAVAA